MSYFADQNAGETRTPDDDILDRQDYGCVMRPAAPAPSDLDKAQAEAARLAQTLRFLASDIESYVAELKRREMTHIAKDQIGAMQQSLGIAQSVLRESNLHQPILGRIELWRDGHAELARASSLLLRTVHDTLRHGLTLTARANLDDACRQLAPLLGTQATEGTRDG